ncbi:cytochrome P450 714C2-like [Papaver somniferum]|uniref:cytochrome P450 714C2-like n=1 Tax=Papaver somniferum TaxID=3469 RepID=UPI000E6F5022|nr:cytochrome P450 714C2-like [Papaver somniferum]
MITNMLFSFILITLSILCYYLYEALWLKPEKLRNKLRNQGIMGQPPSFLSGNVSDMMRIKSMAAVSSNNQSSSSLSFTDDYMTSLFPHFEQWRKEYGTVFTYATGNVQHLYVGDPYLVKEISLCQTWALGKPLYLHKEIGPLFGNGVVRSNGKIWAHQRKTIAPEFFTDKVKGMVGIMVASTVPVLRLWEDEIEKQGGIAELRVDIDLTNISADIISKACFGSSFSKGKVIFSKLRDLVKAMSQTGLLVKIPALRYLPTKNNREVWRLVKEIRKLILKVAENRRQESIPERDLLHMILEGANNLGEETANDFIVDNCKNIYIAGDETVASVATWALLFLASHPQWQTLAREEVLQLVPEGCLPDAEMLHKMKILTMVLQETLRLMPPTSLIAREVFDDVQFGDIINIPEGINFWIPISTLHRNLEIWGPDANEFKPERFVNGILGATKVPHAYIMFGLGPRTCLGQKFAIAELKIMISLILSKFCFSSSPNYKHAPAFTIVIVPKHGLQLLVKKFSRNCKE